MDGCELQDVIGRWNLLELAAEIALRMPKILKPKEGIRHAGACAKSLQSLCVGPSSVEGGMPRCDGDHPANGHPPNLGGFGRLAYGWL